jgi:N-carbamoylputrescine amidase
MIQMKCDQDTNANYRKCISRIREAADQGAKIVCTQELFKSRYFPTVEDVTYFDLAEPLDFENKTVKELSTTAKELDIVLISSHFEKAAAGVFYNTVLVFDADGSLAGRYRKMHIPQYFRFHEKYYFSPGDLGFQAISTRFGEIGILICYDQWVPEAARLTALKGAEIIFIPTAVGVPDEEAEILENTDETWQIVQRGHAVANVCYLAAINRVGYEEYPNAEGGVTFYGRSFVSDPFGAVIAEASSTEEEILISEVDLGLVRETRDKGYFVFRDRRVDAYKGISERYLD